MNIYDSLELLLAHRGAEITLKALANGWITVVVSDYGTIVIHRMIKPESCIKNTLRRMIVKALENERWS